MLRLFQRWILPAAALFALVAALFPSLLFRPRPKPLSHYRPEDVIGSYAGKPIIYAATRSVYSIFKPIFDAPGSPRFGHVPAATYADDEPVIGVTGPGATPRAYSTWFLNARELVHDKLGKRALLITW